MTSHNGNGFTQKEMLQLILEGQQDINKRIDELHEKVNQKISRQEFGTPVRMSDPPFRRISTCSSHSTKTLTAGIIFICRFGNYI